MEWGPSFRHLTTLKMSLAKKVFIIASISVVQRKGALSVAEKRHPRKQYVNRASTLIKNYPSTIAYGAEMDTTSVKNRNSYEY